MKEVVIDKVTDQPETVVGFLDFLLCRLLEQGPALLEADAAVGDAESVHWRFMPNTTLGPEPSTVRFVRHGFRPALARWGFLCGISPYGGHVLFQIRFADEGHPRPERFAIFLCNQPTTGFWIRVYLYAIDGVYPNYGGMFDKKPGNSPSERV